MFFTRETIKIKRTFNRKTYCLGENSSSYQKIGKNFMKLKTESQAIKTYG